MRRQGSALVVARVARVNLMPVAEIERRERETRMRRWLLVLLVVVAAAACVCAAAASLAAQVVVAAMPLLP